MCKLCILCKDFFHKAIFLFIFFQDFMSVCRCNNLLRHSACILSNKIWKIWKEDLCLNMTCSNTKLDKSCKEKTNYFAFFLFFTLFLFFLTAFKRFPRWATFRHHHALEQRDFAALPFWVCQPWLPQVSVSAYQNLLLCSWGIPPPAGRCPASDILCVLRFHGSPKGQHSAGNSWYAYDDSLKFPKKAAMLRLMLVKQQRHLQNVKSLGNWWLSLS